MANQWSRQIIHCFCLQKQSLKTQPVSSEQASVVCECELGFLLVSAHTSVVRGFEANLMPSKRASIVQTPHVIAYWVWIFFSWAHMHAWSYFSPSKPPEGTQKISGTSHALSHWSKTCVNFQHHMSMIAARYITQCACHNCLFLILPSVKVSLESCSHLEQHVSCPPSKLSWDEVPYLCRRHQLSKHTMVKEAHL